MLEKREWLFFKHLHSKTIKQMKKLVFILLALCFTLVTAKAQTPRSINLELLGVHNLVGVSFDSRFNENGKFGYKIGLGYGYESSTYVDGWSIEINGKSAAFRTSPVGYLRDLSLTHVVSLPVSAYYLFGKNNHHFDLGLGVSPYYAHFRDVVTWTSIVPDAGNGFRYYCFLQTAYRYESPKSPFIFSIGIDIPFKTPGSDFEQAIGLYPKFSIGYRL